MLAFSQKKLSGYIEFKKVDITIKKNSIPIRLKSKRLDRFSPNLVRNFT